MEIGELLHVRYRDAHREYILSVVAGTHSGQIVRRSNQQARSHQQSEGQRDLKHRHSAQQTTFCAPRTAGRSGAFDAERRVESRDTECRQEPGKRRSQGRRAETEEHRSAG